MLLFTVSVLVTGQRLTCTAAKGSSGYLRIEGKVLYAVCAALNAVLTIPEKRTVHTHTGRFRQ